MSNKSIFFSQGIKNCEWPKKKKEKGNGESETFCFSENTAVNEGEIIYNDI